MQGDRSRQKPVSRRVLIGGGIGVLAAFLSACSQKKTHPPTPTVAESTSTNRPDIASLVSQLTITQTPTPTPSASPTSSTPLIFLDPGHGGIDDGAVGTTVSGVSVDEKTVTLAIALRSAAKLRAAGYRVLLSRPNDSLPGLTSSDLTRDGGMLTPAGVLDDLQRRIELANSAGASLLLSIHLNANTDPATRGTETYYDSARPFASKSHRFAVLVQQSLMSAYRAHGFTTPDRGVIDDTKLQTARAGVLPDWYNHLVLLGPAVPGQLRPSQMPGVLNESLFISNPEEATAAVSPSMQDLIAGAFTQAIVQYFDPNA